MADASEPKPLPKAVRAMAERLGAQRIASGRAEFRQSGTLRNIGQERWMRFTAHQWSDAQICAFRWRARVGPMGAVHVEDALIDGAPVGAVKALGLFPMARAAPSPALLKGELMRYLAEVPWVPDAILSNPHLDWQDLGDQKLQVATQYGAVHATIEIQLDARGLPHRIGGLRPAMEGKSFIDRPWYGEFSDFREVQGRCIPHAGKSGWIVDDCSYEVWRGELTNWSAIRD